MSKIYILATGEVYQKVKDKTNDFNAEICTK